MTAKMTAHERALSLSGPLSPDALIETPTRLSAFEQQARRIPRERVFRELVPSVMDAPYAIIDGPHTKNPDWAAVRKALLGAK